VSNINNLFVVPNLYIVYSDKFRIMFNLSFIFLKNTLTEEYFDEREYYGSDHVISTSNKSILDNLLN
jgi:hypothetical protein